MALATLRMAGEVVRMTGQKVAQACPSVARGQACGEGQAVGLNTEVGGFDVGIVEEDFRVSFQGDPAMFKDVTAIAETQ